MKRTLFSLWMVYGLLTSCSDSKETRLQRHLIQGNEKLVQQEYELAERFYNAALKIDSCYADALNNLGTVYHRRKDNERAVSYYTMAISCRPDFTAAYFNRANVYNALNRPALALKDLESVEKEKPDTIVLYQLRALSFWKLHEYDNAVANYRSMLKGTSEDADLLINIGTIYGSEKKFDSAKYYLNRALVLKPNDPNACNAYAMVEADMGHLSESKNWLTRALESSPRDPYFLNNKGYLLLLEGKYDEAISFINESIGIDPYNGWAYRNKGMYYLLMSNPDEAIRLLKRAEESDPLMDKLYFLLGDALARKGDKAMSCSYFQKAYEAGQLTAKELKEKCP